MEFAEDRIEQPPYLVVGGFLAVALGEKLPVEGGGGLAPEQIGRFALLAFENASDPSHKFHATLERKR